MDTTTIITQQGKQFCENSWMILHVTYQEFYLKYIKLYPNNRISHGTFYLLKPFYITVETEKHRNVLLQASFIHTMGNSSHSQVCRKSKYCFTIQKCDHLTQHCKPEWTTNLESRYTPSKNEVCKDIDKTWQNFSSALTASSDENVCIPFTNFQKIEHTTQKGFKLAEKNVFFI